MSDQPWVGDACSLVDAFRARTRSPMEELEATLDAVAASTLNAFSHIDAEGARRAAGEADVDLPFGGLPVGIKELDAVAGWPHAEASLVFADRIADHDATTVARLRQAGAVLVGQTTASEFGGLNVSTSRLHGITRNPWNRARTTGGSSAGRAAAVAGGLLSLATGGDGGGSIRIPAGFTGLVGMKGTAGRIPRGPHTAIAPMTVVLGCLARSIRDVARYYDVCSGHHPRDPYSLPKVLGWERDLGSHRLKGRRVAIVPALGSAHILGAVDDLVRESGEALAKHAGLVLVETSAKLPPLGLEWVMSNMAALLVELDGRWPACSDQLTPEMAFGLTFATQAYNLEMAARVERSRTEANEAMADLFDTVDFVIAATNPDVAFPAEIAINTRVGDVRVGAENNGILTIPANVSGNPAISIPAGSVDGLPVGLQVIGRHHEDALLLDLGLAAERLRPWPLVAPGCPQ